MTAKKQFYIYTSLLAAGSWAWLGYSAAKPDSQATICLFRNLCRLPCPSCGITRSVHALLHNSWREAFAINPLGYVAILLLCIMPLWIIADAGCRSASCYRFYHKGESWLKTRPGVMIIFFGLITVNWAWNIFKHL